MSLSTEGSVTVGTLVLQQLVPCCSVPRCFPLFFISFAFCSFAGCFKTGTLDPLARYLALSVFIVWCSLILCDPLSASSQSSKTDCSWQQWSTLRKHAQFYHTHTCYPVFIVSSQVISYPAFSTLWYLSYWISVCESRTV